MEAKDCNHLDNYADDKRNVPRIAVARRLFLTHNNSDMKNSEVKPLTSVDGKQTSTSDTNPKQVIKTEIKERENISSQNFETLHEAYLLAKVELAIEQHKTADLQIQNDKMGCELLELKRQYKSLETRHNNLKEQISSLNKENVAVMLSFTAEMGLMKAQIVENLFALEKKLDEDSE